jgi:hypothetical protein
MSLICAWLGIASMPHLNPNAAAVRHQLHGMRSELDARIADRAELPRRLDELELVVSLPGPYPVDSAGNVLDPWGHPYRYEPGDGTYTLVCYGRDGRPGGTGPDADITGDEPPDSSAPLTLSQFVHDPPTNQMIWAYLISAVSAAAATFVLTRNRPTTNTSAFGILVALAAAAGSAVFAAFIMSLLHVPNYH